MEFSEIKREVCDLKFHTLRMDCDNYFEAVVVKGEIKKLMERLEKLFGAPAFPSKDRIPFQLEQAVNGFGGIMPGQTLYFRNDTQVMTLAMLWPWQDGVYTTVKIIQK